jgi:hypothetical protein
MSSFILLDNGVLGMVAHPNASRNRPCKDAVTEWVAAGHLVRIPEIADYEQRRSMRLERMIQTRAGNTYLGIERLDELVRIYGLLPITTELMQLASEMWANARFTGNPTAGNKAIDADCIICAQSALLVQEGHTVQIATTDVDDLTRLGADAKTWDRMQI